MKLTRSLLVAALALAVIPSSITVSAQATKSRHAERNLRRDLKKTRTELSKAKSELRVVKKAEKRTRVDIAQVDNKLHTVQDQLESTRDKLRDSLTQQKRLEKETAVAITKLQERKDQAKRRIKQLYIRGDVSFASAMTGADSVGDLASRRFLFQRLALKDKQLFQEVRELHKTVLAQKVAADKLVVRIQGLVADQRQQELALKEARQEKHQALLAIKDQREDLEQMVAQLDAEENEIANKIMQFQMGSASNSLKPFRGKLGIPCAGSLGSRFGMRNHPILRRSRMHAGIDIRARSGTPIKAAADGIVISSSYMRGYGNCVIIDHGGGISTLYAHASRLVVRSGARVQKGQLIANVGSTGLSTGPHLHFEVRRNGRAENPLNYL